MEEEEGSFEDDWKEVTVETEEWSFEGDGDATSGAQNKTVCGLFSDALSAAIEAHEMRKLRVPQMSI